MLGSILVIEQVETLPLFYISKDRTCAQFDPDHRTSGNLTFISKDKNLYSVRSWSPNWWKPYLYFIYLRTETHARFDRRHQTGGNPISFYLRTKTCSHFDPDHWTCRSLISILSKDRLESYLYFTKEQKPLISLTSVIDQKHTLIWLHHIHKWA